MTMVTLSEGVIDDLHKVVKQLQKQLEESRETNRKLNRRCQQAEMLRTWLLRRERGRRNKSAWWIEHIEREYQSLKAYRESLSALLDKRWCFRCVWKAFRGG